MKTEIAATPSDSTIWLTPAVPSSVRMRSLTMRKPGGAEFTTQPALARPAGAVAETARMAPLVPAPSPVGGGCISDSAVHATSATAPAPAAIDAAVHATRLD